jgi:lysophospholipase L1-like esterase
MNLARLRLKLIPILLVLGWSSLGFGQLPTNSVAHQDSSKWEYEVAAFEAADRTNPPPKNCILFVGSSSIRLWSSLKADFPGLPVVNRGFGGSELADSVNLAERLIFPYEPREVVIYAGANDLAGGKAPGLVFGDFVALIDKIQQRLPNTRVAFIASAPNPKRWAIVEKVKTFNGLVQDYCREHQLVFIDVFPLMLGSDGLPKPDIFREDGLHMNARGYAIWKEAIGPQLK